MERRSPDAGARSANFTGLAFGRQMPIAASRPAANALRGQLGVVVKNTGASDHVLSNSDIDVAQEVVDFLLGPDPEVDTGAGDDAE